MILGVTGPNEYENNVNNNWYTNYSCVETLKSIIKAVQDVKTNYADDYFRICSSCHFDEKEIEKWREIANNIYLPKDDELGIFVQQDGYLDKELKSVHEIPADQRPVNQHWSWDLILRSCFIKQSDVLLGIYLYYQNFSESEISKNFNFYEPKTLHESSLSPYIHSILAARIGDLDKAYDLFLHATRLDLDNYNNELSEGLHLTSMPGSWLALVQGFAGMQIKGDQLSFNPTIPTKWKKYSFNINFRGNTLHLEIKKSQLSIKLIRGEKVNISVYESVYSVIKGKEVIINR